VRSGDWKYHEREIFKVEATQRDTKGPTLYNLKDDIGESKNVIAQYPEVAERLKKALDAHKKYLQKTAQATPKKAVRKKVAPQKEAPKKLDWSKVKAGDVFETKTAPDMVKKPVKIRGTLAAPANAEQVIVAHGGSLVGYTLYLSGGDLVFAISTGRKHLERVRVPVKTGLIRFEAGLDKTGHLFVQVGDSAPVRSKTGGHWIVKWPAEDLSVGFDAKLPVDNKAPKGEFKGTLGSLVVE